MDQIRSKVNDELWILNFFEVRYVYNDQWRGFPRGMKWAVVLNFTYVLCFAALVYGSGSDYLQLAVGKDGAFVALLPVYVLGAYRQGELNIWGDRNLVMLFYWMFEYACMYFDKWTMLLFNTRGGGRNFSVTMKIDQIEQNIIEIRINFFSKCHDNFWTFIKRPPNL